MKFELPGEFVKIENKEYWIVEKQIYPVKYSVKISDNFEKSFKKIYKKIKGVNIDDLLKKITKYFSFSYFLNKYGSYRITDLFDGWSIYKAYPPFSPTNTNVKNSGNRLILALNEKNENIILICYYSKPNIKITEENLLNHYKIKYKKILIETLKNEH